MISLAEIRKDYPTELQHRHFYDLMLKEYFQYGILDIIFNSEWGRKLSFIGGTCLRILHGIYRFSEDLDFDNFDLQREDFMKLTDLIVNRIKKEGIDILADDKEKDLKLKAFRRNLVFPGFLHNQKLSGHKEEKFLIKIETEPHFFNYIPTTPIIQKFNIFTQINATPVDILLSMKIGAMLERQKGRDYYDCILLMGKTHPNWEYLKFKFGINSPEELKKRILESIKTIDFKLKAKDFERLVFNPSESVKVRLFPEYIAQKDFKQMK